MESCSRIQIFSSKTELKSVNSLFVAYENSAKNTYLQLCLIMDFIGIPFQDCQLRWRHGVHRDIHGSVIRIGYSKKISLDLKWVFELSFH